jgi:hypothetical protein
MPPLQRLLYLRRVARRGSQIMTLAQAGERLHSFRSLKAGWDSYGGQPISEKAIQMAGSLLLKLGDGWTPVPCSDGGVQLEFHDLGIDVEISVQDSSDSEAQKK